MVVREYDYIRGNTALAPERKERVTEKQEKKRKKASESQKLNRNNKKRTKEIIYLAVLMAVLGAASLYIDSYVYKIQKDLSNLEVEIKNEMDVNEAIKVDLLKFASLDNINNVASNNIGMVYPNKSNTITIDMSKEYFSHIKKEEKNNKTNLIAKIMESFN